MFTPTNLDPNRKYPVVDYIYPGPQSGSVGSWALVLQEEITRHWLN
jgi:dipeptidyl aminopeptidase/acylaminoacyl peptidase